MLCCAERAGIDAVGGEGVEVEERPLSGVLAKLQARRAAVAAR